MLRLVVLLCLGVALAQDETPPTENPCSDLQWHSVTSDSCLTIHDGLYDYVSWSAARKVCQDDGGDLVKIVNRHMNRDLGYFLLSNMFKTFTQKIYWIGYHETAEEGTWTWLDESPGVSNYTNWADDKIEWSNSEVQNCAKIGQSDEFFWGDGKCNGYAYFICENPV